MVQKSRRVQPALAEWWIVALAVLAVATVGVLAVVVISGQREAGSANVVQQAGPDAGVARKGVELAASPTVLFSGDSLSDGWYASTEAKGFRPIVEAALTAARPGASFIQEHKAGYTTQRVADSYPVPAGVNLAVVELGTNDLTKKTSPEQFVGQYNAYLDDIKAKSPDTGLICLGAFYRATDQSNAIDATIKAACEQHNGIYLDITAVYEADGMRGPENASTWLGPSDKGHPNDAGHARIAEMVLSQIITG